MSQISEGGARIRRSVAFQGVFGAFSHEACVQALPDHAPIPCASFDEVFAAVGEGRCHLAIVPVENSIAGLVPDVARLLPTSGLEVVREHTTPIHLQLLGVRGASLTDARTAESHPMALGQCGDALAKLGLQPIRSFDTAGAAQAVAEAGDRSRAAVASRTAGGLYGLDVLAENIEDRGDNRTRFLVLARPAA
jgi:prephenate dehydratase